MFSSKVLKTAISKPLHLSLDIIISSDSIDDPKMSHPHWNCSRNAQELETLPRATSSLFSAFITLWHFFFFTKWTSMNHCKLDLPSNFRGSFIYMNLTHTQKNRLKDEPGQLLSHERDPKQNQHQPKVSSSQIFEVKKQHKTIKPTAAASRSDDHWAPGPEEHSKGLMIHFFPVLGRSKKWWNLQGLGVNKLCWCHRNPKKCWLTSWIENKTCLIKKLRAIQTLIFLIIFFWNTSWSMFSLFNIQLTHVISTKNQKNKGYRTLI